MGEFDHILKLLIRRVRRFEFYEQTKMMYECSEAIYDSSKMIFLPSEIIYERPKMASDIGKTVSFVTSKGSVVTF